MDRIKLAAHEIIEGVRDALASLDPQEVESFISLLGEARTKGFKVLVVGAGRSGFVARAFAMRLMHLGLNVYVVGETITPSIEKGDILIAISGSGTTSMVLAAAEAAKALGARVVAVTSYPDSPLGKLADLVVTVKGRTKVSARRDYLQRQIMGVHEPLAPLGTLFEISALIFLDSLIVELMHRFGVTEREMARRHAKIE